MGRTKKKVLVLKPFCYYCEKECDDEAILHQHQKNRHFGCTNCKRTFSTATAMAAHLLQVHKETLTSVPNAKRGRDAMDVQVYGMQGVPDAVIEQRIEHILKTKGKGQFQKKDVKLLFGQKNQPYNMLNGAPFEQEEAPKPQLAPAMTPLPFQPPVMMPGYPMPPMGAIPPHMAGMPMPMGAMPMGHMGGPPPGMVPHGMMPPGMAIPGMGGPMGMMMQPGMMPGGGVSVQPPPTEGKKSNFSQLPPHLEQNPITFEIGPRKSFDPQLAFQSSVQEYIESRKEPTATDFSKEIESGPREKTEEVKNGENEQETPSTAQEEKVLEKSQEKGDEKREEKKEVEANQQS